MEKTPNHVAIIMDGNGRWAKKSGLNRTFGHKKGAEVTQEIIEAAAKFGVKYLTLYAFSAENWNRPEKEVSFLMDLLKMQISSKIKTLHKNGIKLRIIGDLSKLSQDLRDQLTAAEELTKNNEKLVLSVALSYGSRQEILQAVEKSGGDVTKFEQGLYTAGIPDPDLLIRTGGEKRISNFLLWQIAYTELFFSDKLWPDFSEDDLKEAILDYAKRERRFGNANE